MPTTRRRRIIAFLLASTSSTLVESFSLLSHRSPLTPLTPLDADMRGSEQYSVEDDPAAPAVVRILGVCGGIGCGKSTACQMLVDPLGCIGLIDADKLAHVVYEPRSLVHAEIAAEFGSDLLNENGEIERSKLGAIVFNNVEAMSVRHPFLCAMFSTSGFPDATYKQHEETREPRLAAYPGEN